MDFEQWCRENTDIGRLTPSLQSSIPEQYIGFYVSRVFSDVEYQKQFDWLEDLSLDMYVPSIRLAIEYDGGQYHRSRRADDIRKTELCYSNGVTVFRIIERDKKHTDEITKYKENTVEYYYTRGYSSFYVAVEALFSLICGRYQLFECPDVDLKRDQKDIVSYVQQKYYQKTIACVWPESEMYWDTNANKKSVFDVFYTNNNSYILKCPYCGKNFSFKPYDQHRRKSFVPCECEVSSIVNDLETLVHECIAYDKKICFDASLQSRRIFDRIPLRVMLEGDLLSDEELILYKKSRRSI